MNFSNQENYNCTVTTDQGNSYKVYANWIHNNQLDHWQGWECHAGATRLYMDKTFNVWSGECKNDHLGNALTDFDLLDHTVCKQPTCTGCTDDLVVTKKKIL